MEISNFIEEEEGELGSKLFYDQISNATAVSSKSFSEEQLCGTISLQHYFLEEQTRGPRRRKIKLLFNDGLFGRVAGRLQQLTTKQTFQFDIFLYFTKKITTKNKFVLRIILFDRKNLCILVSEKKS